MKEFVFGFQIAAAIKNNFNNAFSSASSQIMLLNEKIRNNSQIVTMSAEATKRGILNMKSYNNVLAQTYKYYAKATEHAQKYLKIQGELNQRRSSMNQNQANIMSLGGIALTLTEPMKKAIQFETAMSDVRKVVDFKTPEQFQQMNKDILKLTRTIPMAASELASIVAAGGQSGIAREDLLAFAKSAAKMGTAFDITADQAGEMMAKWRTAFKMNQNQVVELADKINYLSNKTAASAPLISDVVTRIGPLGSVGGVASGEIAALGASLVGSGVQSEVAATGIKNFILTMVAGEGATKSQSAAFARLGLDSQDMAKRMQTDAKGAIMDVLNAIKSLSKEEQASTLQQLFGKESIGAIAPLLSNLDALKTNFELVASNAEYAGSMEDEFKTKSQTTANQLTLMKNEFNAVMTSVGNGMIPAFRLALGILSPLGRALGNVFTQNKELVGGILVTGTAITAFGALANMAAWVWNGTKLAINGAQLAYASVKQYIFTHNIATKASIILTKTWTAAQWAWNTAIKAGNLGIHTAKIIIHKGVTLAASAATRTWALAQWAWNTAIKAGSLGIHTAKIIIHKGVTLAASAATRTWALAQWAWNAAMSANPIGMVIAGVAGLIAAGYALYRNWDTVKQFFSNLWDSPVAKTLMFVSGPIGWVIAASTALIANWDMVKQWFITLWNSPSEALQQFIDGIKNKFDDTFTWIKDKWDSIQRFLSTPIFGKVNILAQNTVGNTPNVAQNASGGIYPKGAFLTTFAETSGESAIPHARTARNIGLLAKTNDIMGNPLGAGANINVYPNINMPAPVSNVYLKLAAHSSSADEEKGAPLQSVYNPVFNPIIAPNVQPAAVNIQQEASKSMIPIVNNVFRPLVQPAAVNIQQEASKEMTPIVNNVFNPFVRSSSVNVQESQAQSPLATLMEKTKQPNQKHREVNTGAINATFSPNITIQGNADETKLRQVLDDEMAKFKRMLEELRNQQRRVSYA